MPLKPRYLWPDYASQFGDRSVVEAYRHRAPYPPETFDMLLGLIGNGPPIVLDAGCGRGELARPMAALVDRVASNCMCTPTSYGAGLLRHERSDWADCR